MFTYRIHHQGRNPMFGTIFYCECEWKNPPKNEISSWERFILMFAGLCLSSHSLTECNSWDDEEALKLAGLIAISNNCICLRRSHQKVLLRLLLTPEG